MIIGMALRDISVPYLIVLFVNVCLWFGKSNVMHFAENVITSMRYIPF